MKDKIRSFLIALAVVALLALTESQINFDSVPPVAAQGPGIQVEGTPVSATTSGAINFAETAREEMGAPRIPQTPIAIHPPLPGGEDARASESHAPFAVARADPLVASPAPAASFQAAPDNTTYIPPDTNGAVGLNHLMVTHNGTVRIQNKSGGLISNVTLATFWSGLGISGPFDPKVLYDPFNNRWMFTVVTNARSSSSSVCIATSQTSDPTGIWYRFCYDADNANVLWADFPSIGFNKDWIAVSVNMFTIAQGSFSRGQLYAFSKANLYANDGVNGHTVFATGSVPFTLVPAITLDNSIATEHLIRHYSNSGGTIRKSTLTGAVSSPTLTIDTATVTSILGAWSVPGGEFLPQAGGTRLIDVGDARIRNVVLRTVAGVTTIWCTQTIVLPSGGSPTRAAAQWWQLNSNASSSVVLQQGRVEDPTATQTNGGKHFAYPSLAINQFGDMLIGYSRFSSAEYATAAYSFRASGDAAGTTRDDFTLKAGLGYYEKTYSGTVNRWGDYSNTVVDPVNDTDMWTIQEYADTPVGTGNDSGRWATWWGMISFYAPPIPSTIFLPFIKK